MLGILSRYVIAQILNTFLLALTAITGIFVLFMVMAEAARQGLAPLDILRVIPFIIPSSLPYTIPVALLFAVSVVYGRMAGDNEIMAVKAAGLSAMKMLWPSWWMALGVSVSLFFLSSETIPRATHSFRKIIFQDTEDMFYKFLKKEGQFNNQNWPFYIGVKDVEDRVLIGATFKHRKSKDEPNVFDLQVFAKKARIHFMPSEGKAQVELEDSETTGGQTRPFLFWVNGRRMLEYPLPNDGSYKLEKRIQEQTNSEMTAIQAVLREKIDRERPLQAVTAAMWIASGRLNRVDWPQVGDAYREHRGWVRKNAELETEKHLRVALAAGTFFFVFLGSPVGILFARRDFLSAFITCFLPIIVLYYPLTLLGVNLAKEEVTWPSIVFVGNFVIAVMAGLVLPSVRKH